MGGTVGMSEFLRLLFLRLPGPGVMFVEVPFELELAPLVPVVVIGFESPSRGEPGGLFAPLTDRFE